MSHGPRAIEAQNMGQKESKERPEEPQPKEQTKEGCEEAPRGIPPGVSFDTEEGRRAQGMEEDDFSKKKPEPAEQEDEPERKQQ